MKEDDVLAIIDGPVEDAPGAGAAAAIPVEQNKK